MKQRAEKNEFTNCVGMNPRRRKKTRDARRGATHDRPVLSVSITEPSVDQLPHGQFACLPQPPAVSRTPPEPRRGALPLPLHGRLGKDPPAPRGLQLPARDPATCDGPCSVPTALEPGTSGGRLAGAAAAAAHAPCCCATLPAAKAPLA